MKDEMPSEGKTATEYDMAPITKALDDAIKKLKGIRFSGVYCNKPDEHITHDDSIESGMVYCRHCYRELEARLSKIRAKVDEQANDEGIWFVSKTITEDYLQCALRDLHQVIEGGK